MFPRKLEDSREDNQNRVPLRVARYKPATKLPHRAVAAQPYVPLQRVSELHFALCPPLCCHTQAADRSAGALSADIWLRTGLCTSLVDASARCKRGVRSRTRSDRNQIATRITHFDHGS